MASIKLISQEEFDRIPIMCEQDAKLEEDNVDATFAESVYAAFLFLIPTPGTRLTPYEYISYSINEALEWFSWKKLPASCEESARMRYILEYMGDFIHEMDEEDELKNVLLEMYNEVKPKSHEKN